MTNRRVEAYDDSLYGTNKKSGTVTEEKSGTFNDSDSDALRLGDRMRRIRTALGLTQGELGEKIGLSADRVQKYENGFRKPKADMLRKIADALGVETMALTDPIVTTPVGVMYALFEMEKAYNAFVSKTERGFEMSFSGTNSLSGTYSGTYVCATSSGTNICGTNHENLYGSDSIDDYILEWTLERNYIEEKLRNASTDEEKNNIILEYDMWKWTFPKSVSEKIDIEKRKKILKEKIELLQLELSKLS